LLLAAEAKGLGTCPIGLITAYASDIAGVLSIPENKEIVLGIALGYADESSPVNKFKTGRADQSEILSWYE
jgi:nitroreductase